MNWFRTVDGDLINLEHVEAFAYGEIKGEERPDYWEVRAELRNGQVTVASNFATAAEAANYIRENVEPFLNVNVQSGEWKND